MMVGAGILKTIESYPTLTLIQININEKISVAIVNSKINKSKSNHYVARQKLEDDIQKNFVSEPSGIYNIVYGPRGVGKSELLEHVAIGKPGFIKINVTSAHSKNDLIQQITTEVLNHPAGLDIKSLIISIEKCDIIPTIIFDVERGGEKDHDRVIDAVRSLAKALAHNCRIVIILSEANMATKFGKDLYRKRFTLVQRLLC
jgi:predicted AAA+ superfamily ATPase